MLGWERAVVVVRRPFSQGRYYTLLIMHAIDPSLRQCEREREGGNNINCIYYIIELSTGGRKLGTVATNMPCFARLLAELLI